MRSKGDDSSRVFLTNSTCDAFDLCIGYVSAISPFFMVIDTATWSVVMFVVVLSLGESIWSPRTYDYTMTVAPEVGIQK